MNDQRYVDTASGVIAVPEGAPLPGQVEALLAAPTVFFQAMSGPAEAYAVAGTDTVNEVPCVREAARYQVHDALRSVFLQTDQASVDSTLWYARDGRYLVRVHMTISAPPGATPQATPGGATSGSFSADVTQVGSAPPITAPM